MNRKTLKYKFFSAAAAAVIAASFLTSCTNVQASLTVPGASSSVTYEKTISLPKATVPSTGSGTQKIEYYFPRGGQKAQTALIDVINSAQKSLDIAIYSFTDKQISAAVLRAHQRGVSVRLISDREQSSGQYQKVVLKQLSKAGIPIKIDTHAGLMHLKVTIADQKIATTGSFNYTKSAEETNDEVFVVLKDEKSAQDFEAQFSRMWNDKKSFTDYK